MRIIHVNDDSSLEEYNKYILNSKAIVLFYMDGCMHCEMMKPEWLKFEDYMKNNDFDKDNNVIIARVNQKYMNEIEGDKNILGYPTILYLENGKQQDEYSGERTNEGFKQFYNKKIHVNRQNGGRRNNRKKKHTRKSKKHTNKKGKKTKRVKTRRVKKRNKNKQTNKQKSIRKRNTNKK